MKLFYFIKLTIIFFLYHRINRLHHDICIVGRHLNDNQTIPMFCKHVSYTTAYRS